MRETDEISFGYCEKISKLIGLNKSFLALARAVKFATLPFPNAVVLTLE